MFRLATNWSCSNFKNFIIYLTYLSIKHFFLLTIENHNNPIFYYFLLMSSSSCLAFVFFYRDFFVGNIIMNKRLVEVLRQSLVCKVEPLSSAKMRTRIDLIVKKNNTRKQIFVVFNLRKNYSCHAMRLKTRQNGIWLLLNGLPMSR